tara:strand:+ start:771 stop:1088 length:318 start_codon:yes stop_codon:yes gene_type:complete
MSTDTTETGIKTITEQDFNQAPFVGVSTTNNESELRDYIINYTGTKLDPKDGKVDINMIAEILADEFPEFTYAFAEENFVRGYELGLDDAAELYTRATKESSSEE